MVGVEAHLSDSIASWSIASLSVKKVRARSRLWRWNDRKNDNERMQLEVYCLVAKNPE